MRILIVGDFNFEMYEKAFYHAFKTNGDEVDTFKWKDFFYQGSNKLLRFSSKLQYRFVFGLKIERLNKFLVNSVTENTPDFVFIYRGTHIYPRSIEKIKNLGCIVFSYHNDNPFTSFNRRFYNRFYIKAAKFCDCNFVYRKKNIEDFNKIGISNTRVLLPYYIQNRNFPVDSRKIYDISFVGHYENDGRDVFLKALIDAKLKFTLIAGVSGWRKSKHFKVIEPFVGECDYNNYNLYLSQSKIALVFLSKLNQDTYTRRCFEIPATKTLMLCEYTEDMASMFEPDKEAIYFKSPDELVSKCRYLLQNEKLIEEIAENGYNKLHISGHEVSNRASEILKIYSAFK